MIGSLGSRIDLGIDIHLCNTYIYVYIDVYYVYTYVIFRGFPWAMIFVEYNDNLIISISIDA